jgi:hypothetical protein
MTERLEKEKEYFSKDDFLEETLTNIEAETSDGKYVIFRRLTKGQESQIRKKTMKMVKTKDGKLEPQIDSEEYQIKLLATALVMPNLTEEEVRDKLTSARADELFFLYSKEVGFGSLPPNL